MYNRRMHRNRTIEPPNCELVPSMRGVQIRRKQMLSVMCVHEAKQLEEAKMLDWSSGAKPFRARLV